MAATRSGAAGYGTLSPAQTPKSRKGSRSPRHMRSQQGWLDRLTRIMGNYVSEYVWVEGLHMSVTARQPDQFVATHRILTVSILDHNQARGRYRFVVCTIPVGAKGAKAPPRDVETASAMDVDDDDGKPIETTALTFCLHSAADFTDWFCTIYSNCYLVMNEKLLLDKADALKGCIDEVRDGKRAVDLTPGMLRCLAEKFPTNAVADDFLAALQEAEQTKTWKTRLTRDPPDVRRRKQWGRLLAYLREAPAVKIVSGMEACENVEQVMCLDLRFFQACRLLELSYVEVGEVAHGDAVAALAVKNCIGDVSAFKTLTHVSVKGCEATKFDFQSVYRSAGTLQDVVVHGFLQDAEVENILAPKKNWQVYVARPWANLLSLDLSHNGLTALPRALRDLVHLESLVLDCNDLTSLDGLEDLSHVVRLSAIKNRLTSARAIKALPHLTYLNLSGNVLTHIPFACLRRVKYLDLGGNQLNTWHDIVTLSQTAPLLDYLVLENNPLENTVNGEDYEHLMQCLFNRYMMYNHNKLARLTDKSEFEYLYTRYKVTVFEPPKVERQAPQPQVLRLPSVPSPANSATTPRTRRRARSRRSRGGSVTPRSSIVYEIVDEGVGEVDATARTTTAAADDDGSNHNNNNNNNNKPAAADAPPATPPPKAASPAAPAFEFVVTPAGAARSPEVAAAAAPAARSPTPPMAREATAPQAAAEATPTPAAVVVGVTTPPLPAAMTPPSPERAAESAPPGAGFANTSSLSADTYTHTQAHARAAVEEVAVEGVATVESEGEAEEDGARPLLAAGAEGGAVPATPPHAAGGEEAEGSLGGSPSTLSPPGSPGDGKELSEHMAAFMATVRRPAVGAVEWLAGGFVSIYTWYAKYWGNIERRDWPRAQQFLVILCHIHLLMVIPYVVLFEVLPCDDCDTTEEDARKKFRMFIAFMIAIGSGFQTLLGIYAIFYENIVMLVSCNALTLVLAARYYFNTVYFLKSSHETGLLATPVVLEGLFEASYFIISLLIFQNFRRLMVYRVGGGPHLPRLYRTVQYFSAVSKIDALLVCFCALIAGFWWVEDEYQYVLVCALTAVSLVLPVFAMRWVLDERRGPAWGFFTFSLVILALQMWMLYAFVIAPTDALLHTLGEGQHATWIAIIAALVVKLGLLVGVVACVLNFGQGLKQALAPAEIVKANVLGIFPRIAQI